MLCNVRPLSLVPWRRSTNIYCSVLQRSAIRKKVSCMTPATVSTWNLVMGFVVLFYCHKASSASEGNATSGSNMRGTDFSFLHLFAEYVMKGNEKLPHLRNRVERLMQAIQLKKAINYHADISASKLLEALTAANCHEPFCYERVEHIGDAYLKWTVSTRLFLKFPEVSEGELTAMRMQIICNSALCQHALDKGLQAYVRINPFVPGREATDLQELSSKVLANVVEALIGTYYVEYGDSGAKHVLEWLGISTSYEKEDVEIGRRGSTVSEEVLATINFKELESTLKYTFQAKNLLAQALTHSSSRQAVMVPIYERLEFIGDAVLDYLLTRHIYFFYKDLPPGRLTDLRQAALNSENFARAMLRHKLHAHILHEAKDVLSQISTFVKVVQKAGSSPYGGGSIKAPKVLGDVMQALAGAIYIDSGLDLDQVWKVFEPLLQPLVTPETVSIHPVRELYELCEQNLKCLEWVYSSAGDVFIAEAVVDGRVIGCGENIQKKTAKKLAAIDALARFKPGEVSVEENGGFSRKTLHELCDKKAWACPQYQKHSESGPAHEKMFTCSASVFIKEDGREHGCVGLPMPTLSKAKDSAAMVLMEELQHQKLL